MDVDVNVDQTRQLFGALTSASDRLVSRSWSKLSVGFEYWNVSIAVVPLDVVIP